MTDRRLVGERHPVHYSRVIERMTPEPKGSAVAIERRNGSDTRVRILDAAAEVLSSQGFAGTKLSDIAQIAEIKAPAIYRYFSSREELVEEVMLVGHLRFIEHITQAIEALPASATPLDRILAAVAAHLEVVLSISEYAAASTLNMGQMPEPIRERQMEYRRQYGAIWRRHLADAAADGQLRPDLDLRAAQGVIIGALSWSTTWWDPGRRPLELLIHNAQALVRLGIER